ncbi:MAG TPA: tail fiber domain-containing protein [Myxococcales bacterium]|nr:tail fiber domain-containing protein [Myxococcales bacterium]
MALPDPYIRRNPNDLITSGDWNDIQSLARQDLRTHNHSGAGDNGPQIGRDGIALKAIDGTLIDPAAQVTVTSLTVTAALKVQGRELLVDVNNLQARTTALESRAGQLDGAVNTLATRTSNLEASKLNAGGGTVSGALTITAALTAQNVLMPSVGNDESKGILFPRDPGGGGGDRAYIRYFVWNGFGATPDPEATKLLIGIDNDGNDVLAFRQQNAERMIIANGNVGINMGAGAPGELLCIGGNGSCIELGAGVTTKEVNAGKIAYAKFRSDAPSLELVGGGGPSYTLRRITMWAEAGAQIYGPLNVTGDVRVAATVWADKVRLGNKWIMSGVGDHWANDDWLRLVNVADTDYYGGLAAGRLYSTSGTLSGSDARLKKNVRRLEGALEKIAALRPVRYEPREPGAGNATQIGLLAQEVEEVFPEVVGVGPEGMKGIDYARLVAPIIQAINELRLAIAAQAPR